MTHHRPLLLLLAAYLASGLLYAFATPPFEASDEVFHYPVVRHIALGQGLPVQKIGVKQAWDQVGSHPPAYYLLSAALTFWVRTDDFDSVHTLNPFARIGIPGTPQNANHTRYPAEALTPSFPPRGAILAVWIIRLFSLLLGAGTVTMTYLLAASLFDSGPASATVKPLPLLAAALVAFNPMFLFISASVNNDNLVTLVGALLIPFAISAQEVQKELGVPVLDPIGIGVKMCELLAGVGYKNSRACYPFTFRPDPQYFL